MSPPILIEGYASLFGISDAASDTVRAGAFARSLRRRPFVPMLLQHRRGAIAGRWTRIVEDGRGLFVRGLVDAPGARSMIERGLDGLSIGFRARIAKPLSASGRMLIDLELVEISLVANPMQPLARFVVPQAVRRAA
ncbi:MAG: HK97 family phage prohead protease [Pseudomonadota bacterium]